MKITKDKIDKNVYFAEQQILGFYHCYNGGDIEGLCEAMGLTGKEFKTMKKNKMLKYLPDELYNEIVDYLDK